VFGPRLAGEGRVEGDDTLAEGGGWGGRQSQKAHDKDHDEQRERGVESPRAHAIEGEFGLGDQVVPAVGGKGDVGVRKDGNDMIFGGTNSSFHRVGAMVKGRDVLKGEVDREEEGCEFRRGFVIEEKVNQKLRVKAEERDNRLEGRDVGGGSSGLHRVQMNVPVMQENEKVLVSCRRFDGEAPGQIGGSAFGSLEDERVGVEGGIKAIGGDRGKLRDEGTVGWGSLFAFVLSDHSGVG
jgi:hypothetical protein